MTTRPLNPDAALPVGIEIGGHAIEAVVAVGETGFVYVASDPLLARQVAVKEYFPPSLAVRHGRTQMRARSASEHQRVMQGRDAFIEESRLLARLDHPALVRVIGAHEAHQTAYRVMPFHAGPTLEQARLERGVPPGDGWVRRMVEDLLGALEVLHDAGIVHGHLHPAQVLLRPDDRPLLLGFGSAARVLQRGVDAAYLPPEMAPGGKPSQRGPWTDLHALAALGWFAAMGTPPAPAIDVRVAFDAAFGPPQSDAEAQQRDRLCAALRKALAPKPDERPQSAAEMRAMLGAEAVGEAAPAQEPELPPEPDPRVRAAIAAAVASIPDLEPTAADAPQRRTSAPQPEPARAPERSTAKPAVPLAGLAPAHKPDAGARAAGDARGPSLFAAPADGAGASAAAASAAAMHLDRAAEVMARRPDAAPATAAGPTAPAATDSAAAAMHLDKAARVMPRAPHAAPASGREPEPAVKAMPPAPAPVQASAAVLRPSQPVFGRPPPARPAVEPLFVPGFSARRADAARQEPAFSKPADAAGQPGLVEPEGKRIEREEPATPRAAPASPAGWAGGTAAPKNVEPAAAVAPREPAWAAEPPQMKAGRPEARPRSRAGWAWAAAVVLGVVTGVGAWQWTELREQGASRVAAAPGITPPTTVTGLEGARRGPAPQEAPAKPAAAAPEALKEPDQAAPTAAGPATTPAVAPPPGDVSPDATPGAPGAMPTPAVRAADGDQPVTSAASRSAPPVAEETVNDRAGSSGTAGPSAGGVARPPARAPAARRPAAAAPAAPATPRATCGNRTNFSLVYCMQQQCRRPAFSAHPQCREFRRTGEVN